MKCSVSGCEAQFDALSAYQAWDGEKLTKPLCRYHFEQIDIQFSAVMSHSLVQKFDEYGNFKCIGCDTPIGHDELYLVVQQRDLEEGADSKLSCHISCLEKLHGV